MKALDLFCCAGGASMGLHQAGFEVVGVDIESQPDYPFTFVQADALAFDMSGFDFVWASPPCQAFTAYKRRKEHVTPRPNLIPVVRAKLQASGLPYVIENVEGARAELVDVRRHRLFETSFPVEQPKCWHHLQMPRFAPATNRTNLRRTVEVGVWRIPLDVQQRAMGIDWMPLEKLSQAIPPAYSKWLAEQWLETCECVKRNPVDGPDLDCPVHGEAA